MGMSARYHQRQELMEPPKREWVEIFFFIYFPWLIEFLLHRDVERETNSNFTGQRFMHLTGGPASSDASSSNKSSLDNRQDADPMQLGVQLLSFKENQLCSAFNLPPTRYLTIKTVLLSNPKISEIDPTEKVILKHLNNSGWIRKAWKVFSSVVPRQFLYIFLAFALNLLLR